MALLLKQSAGAESLHEASRSAARSSGSGVEQTRTRAIVCPIMPKLEILVGLIASGKSTYARSRATEGAIVVSEDAITMGLHGGVYPMCDYTALLALYKSVADHQIRAALMMGRDVVVDATNLSRSTRAKLIEMARECGASSSGVVFRREPPEVHARRRTLDDDRGLSYEHWLELIRSHEEIYEEPCLSEHFDALIQIKSDLDDHKAAQQDEHGTRRAPHEIT